jgi:hypothetical protein
MRRGANKRETIALGAMDMKRYGLWAAWSLCLLSVACGSDRKPDDGADDGGQLGLDGGAGSSDAGDAQTVDASGIDASRDSQVSNTAPEGGSPLVVNDAGQVLCGKLPCQCSDGVVQDQDGLVDMADLECVSAWDKDETSLATGLSGDNRDSACQDCFFDGNSGAGNDGCAIATSCRTLGTAEGAPGGCSTCTPSDRCTTVCQAYTPNGCDCFGCCGVQLGSNIVKNVLLSGTCSVDGSNLSNCTECVPSTACANTCGRCELCPGKMVADLPADCGSTNGADGGVSADGGISADGSVAPSTPTPVCEAGEARCGEGLPRCPSGSSCTFGCCLLTPLL